MSTQNIDIVIPIRLTREFASADNYFMGCISHLQTNTRNFRPIFVDDNSDAVGQSVIETFASNFSSGILIRTHKQRWFTRAVNLGLRLVNTPWAVVLNSDTCVEEGWLEELFAVREEFEKNRYLVGLVGSVYSPQDPRRFVETRHPDFVTGHCWLLNMQAVKEVGYLDETTPKTIHIFSDNYLCYDMNRRGWRTVVSHYSKVLHEAGKSWGHQLHRIPNTLDAVNDQY